MEAKELRYALDVMADYGRVLGGTKPLLIVSANKSLDAYTVVREMATENPEMRFTFAMLVCEDGELYPHAFITRDGSGVAALALDLLYDRVVGLISRSILQLRLGLLLGHRPLAILAFYANPIMQLCPCDCCGGPPPLQLTYQPTMPVKTDAGRRTQYYYDPATDA